MAGMQRFATPGGEKAVDRGIVGSGQKRKSIRCFWSMTVDCRVEVTHRFHLQLTHSILA
jgi:hypothetical protein